MHPNTLTDTTNNNTQEHLQQCARRSQPQHATAEAHGARRPLLPERRRLSLDSVRIPEENERRKTSAVSRNDKLSSSQPPCLRSSLTGTARGPFAQTRDGGAEGGDFFLLVMCLLICLSV